MTLEKLTWLYLEIYMHVHIHLYACNYGNERRGHKLVGEWGGSMKGFLRKEKRRTVIITSKEITIKEK